MKVFKSLTVLFLIALLAACASTPSENTTAPVINDAETDDVIEVMEEVVISEEFLFVEKLQNITLSFTQTPKVTSVNKAFSNPYVITVKDSEENPVSDFGITISYPESKENGTINFKTIEVTTDEKGTYSFNPSKPAFPASTKISAYPTPLNESVLEEAKAKEIQADWKVKSDFITKGAVLFSWDFNEKGKPVTNSFELLSEIKNRGITLIGNAPVNETSDIGKSIQALYKANYAIIGNSYGYLIIGTIKFVKPVEKTDDNYTCTLVAELNGVNMKTGAVVLSTKVEHTATGNNYNTSVSNCKKELSVILADELIFGL